jgi:hypothetical protein
MPEKSKTGRPKNPTTIKLEREIRKRDEEIEMLKDEALNLTNITKDELNCTAYAGVAQDGKVHLVKVKFNFDSGQAVMDSIVKTYKQNELYLLEHKLKELLAHKKESGFITVLKEEQTNV